MNRLLGPQDRQFLHVVASLTLVGWLDEESKEGEAIARHFGLNWNEVRAKVESAHRELGIIPLGGRYRYISPKPLGDYLALEAWSSYSDLLRSLPSKLPTERSVDAFFERWSSIVSQDQAREFAKQELDLVVSVEQLKDRFAVRRWSALALSDPRRAAKNIVRTLERASVAERLGIEGDARREIIAKLVHLAWRSNTFNLAATALGLLAEAENESWSNNATGEFISRFQIYFGGTALPYLERLSVIDDLLSANSVARLRIAIRALTKSAEKPSARFQEELSSDEIMEPEWQPPTEKDSLNCIHAALDRLIELARLANIELKEEFVASARVFSFLLRESLIRNAVAMYLDTIREAYPSERENLRKSIDEVVYRQRQFWRDLGEDEVSQIEAIHMRFVDLSLGSQVVQYVGQSAWSRKEQFDLAPIAREVLQEPSVLFEILPWLTSGEAHDGWRFGQALGDLDRDLQAFERLQDSELYGNDLRLLCGYISAVKARKGENWYGEWIESQAKRSPRMLRSIFEVAWRCGATDRVAHCVLQLLQSAEVPREVVGLLGFARWGESLDAGLLRDILDAMISKGHAETALTILDYRIESHSYEHDYWRDLALKIILIPEIVRSDNMTSYYWMQLSMRYVKEHSDEIAEAIIAEQVDRSRERWFIEHSDAAKVLRACLDDNPEGVWRALEPRLATRAEAHSLSIGFPKGVVDQVPFVAINVWLEPKPEERAAILGRFVAKNFTTDITLAAKILGAYGDREDVSNTFFADYVSGVWWGSASSHWERLAAALDDVVKRTCLPKLRRWAEDSAERLRGMAERDRLREEEERLRGS